MNILLLLMGGSGTRFGSEIPKQYAEINGKPIFYYIYEKYLKIDLINKIIIVTNPSWYDYVEKWVKKEEYNKVSVINGGKTRSESVFNGLKEAKAFAKSDDIVLMHDATHPYVDEKGTKEVVEAAIKYGGATLGAFQYDTCYQMDKDNLIQKVVKREELVAGASPEAFRFGDIYKIYSEATEEDFNKMTSAGAIALANGIRMKVVKANLINLKITYPEDMILFKALCSGYFFPQEAEK